MAPVVPEPVRAGIPGLIKPVCLLLAQVIRFRDQKQNTVNPQAGRRGLAQLKPCKENREWAPQPQALTPGPQPPLPPLGPGCGRSRRKGSQQQGPLGEAPGLAPPGHLRAQGPMGRQGPPGAEQPQTSPPAAITFAVGNYAVGIIQDVALVTLI